MDTHVAHSDDAASAKSTLIEAAVELFGRKGFEKTSVREIVGAAGVAKPTLYYYFGSKHGLGLAVLRRASKILRQEMAREIRQAADVREKMVAVVNAHFTACKQHKELARFVYSLSFSPPEAPAGYDVTEVHADTRDTIAQVVQEAVARQVVQPEWAEGAQIALMGIINIYLMHFLVLGMNLDRKYAELAVKALLDGVGNHRDRQNDE